MFGLVDCNNFFASCERVFRPDLVGKPVVILSNNDGCIVSRSNEAKALGYKMGDPYFKVKEKLKSDGATAFSSNYALYGDMSRRVMSILGSMVPELHIYSIDEAFFDLGDTYDSEKTQQLGRSVVDAIYKGTGIPVTIGIAMTKTLAKVASKYGKTYRGYNGVCIIDSDEKRVKAVKGFQISDVWGIGRRTAPELTARGIKTAYDFTQLSEEWVRKMLHVQGVRTWKELRGENAIAFEHIAAKDSICTSRSFSGKGVDKLSDMEEAVSGFASKCAEKLKEQSSCCGSMTVYASTSRFHEDANCHQFMKCCQFEVPTQDKMEIIKSAMQMLRTSWHQGSLYKKAGVVVWNIVPKSGIQASLFDQVDRGKRNKLDDVVAKINKKSGKGLVKLAVEGADYNRLLTRELLSPRSTTEMNEILVVKAK